MNFRSNKEAIQLFIGDVLVWSLALFLALFARYQEVPIQEVFVRHLAAFGIIFFVWAVSFFIAHLYTKRMFLARSKLASLLINTQIINSAIAVLFFYFIPYFDITPKRILFLHLLFSLPLILLWRLYLVEFFWKGKKGRTLILGEGEEVEDIVKTINTNPTYHLVAESVPMYDAIHAIEEKKPALVIMNPLDAKAQNISQDLADFLFSGTRFMDIRDAYENVFGKVPLTLLDDNWFLENISSYSHTLYLFLKRTMDILISLALGAVSLCLYPLVAIAIILDDGFPVFISQKRVGEKDSLIITYKFRSMHRNETDPTKKSDNTVTRVGKILRASRIDEIPQLWSVFWGDISLIGPRPELPQAVQHYESEIPYYGVRHIIKPGLSGWAQLYGEHAHHGTDVGKTKDKLSYDLYYVKNKSIALDLNIALKTIRVFLSRSGV